MLVDTSELSREQHFFATDLISANLIQDATQPRSYDCPSQPNASCSNALLRDLPEEWTRRNEGDGTFSAFDVVGHLIHGDRTDWIPRARVILEHGETRPFEKFDRLAQVRESQGKSLSQLLDEFTRIRAEKLTELRGLNLMPRISNAAAVIRLWARCRCHSCWRPGLRTTSLIYISCHELWRTSIAGPLARGPGIWA